VIYGWYGAKSPKKEKKFSNHNINPIFAAHFKIQLIDFK